MTWKLLWTDRSGNISLREKEPQKYWVGGGKYFKQKETAGAQTSGWNELVYLGKRENAKVAEDTLLSQEWCEVEGVSWGVHHVNQSKARKHWRAPNKGVLWSELYL